MSSIVNYLSVSPTGQVRHSSSSRFRDREKRENSASKNTPSSTIRKRQDQSPVKPIDPSQLFKGITVPPEKNSSKENIGEELTGKLDKRKTQSV